MPPRIPLTARPHNTHIKSHMSARKVIQSTLTRHLTTSRPNMPTSELVIGALRPDVAKQGLAHIRKDVPPIFNKVQGLLSNHIAHVVKFNGEDVSSEYKPILTLEWDNPSHFHSFYPASEDFKSFAGVFAPYAAAKAQPMLFEPVEGSAKFEEVFSKGGAQIVVARDAGGKKDEVSGAWRKVLEKVNGEGLVGEWSGWGIEEAEGTWAAVLGWRSVEEIDGSVGEEVEKLRGVVKLEEITQRSDERVGVDEPAQFLMPVIIIRHLGKLQTERANVRKVRWRYASGECNKVPGILEDELRLRVQNGNGFDVRKATCLEQRQRQPGWKDWKTWADCLEIAEIRRYLELELACPSLDLVEAMPVVGIDPGGADENGSCVEQDVFEYRASNLKREF
ncbi:hypothetical protein GRF29_28g522045 [Pseudopithomyces chartarum]|uniref:Uncharacterized protein n=1 Tax=Pseudopithomyces chartarum TaxID=1892770 RepID=A0AAN6RJT8_9PLEO|nr:hypothetical protein GRF29_28g522045 [Pseudopithomyces chartarum]